MSNKTAEKQSQLIAVLREGVSVVQMIIFKEVRELLQNNYPEKDKQYHSMLTGAIINELFGTANPQERFILFFNENKAVIEQELLGLKTTLSTLVPFLTDALRIQALCDSQEGTEDTTILDNANKLGLLQLDRDIPLPSSFMTLVRELGEQHNLIIAPVQITPEQDQEMVH